MGDQRLYAAIERERARCRIHDFQHPDCAIRPSQPFRDIYCNPLPYAVSLRLGPRVGVPARLTAAARFTKRT
jgi:hypothetical protein